MLPFCNTNPDEHCIIHLHFPGMYLTWLDFVQSDPHEAEPVLCKHMAILEN